MLQQEKILQKKLNEREAAGTLRSLTTTGGLVDFSSNDYLGFARSPELRSAIDQAWKEFPHAPVGASGSRLLNGNSHFTEELEEEIARFHRAAAGLIFNSGYDANAGLFSCIAGRGDTIICDELIHASVIDGIRMSHATRYTFRHNDPESLREKLKAARGNVFIAVESIYSMDGDEAPLQEISALAIEFGAALIVDEAHATGCFGPGGRGLLSEYQLEEKVFARVITFGKALGVHGAIVLGSDTLRSYLINFARSFIFSTAAPQLSHLAVRMAYGWLTKTDHQALIHEKIALFKKNSGGLDLIPGRSPIQCLLVGNPSKTRSVALVLKENGIDVRAVLHPTVPAGKERLRICLHVYNTAPEISNLISVLRSQL